MQYNELIKTQFISKPIDEVFSFFSKPENLEHITPKYLHFKIQTPLPVKMEVGTVIDYSIRLRGVPIRWRSIISSYEPPYEFVDEQIKGPYSVWHHTHIFREKDNGTEIEDHVKYKIPLGFIGDIANYLFVKKDLNYIFEYRKEIIDKIFINENN